MSLPCCLILVFAVSLFSETNPNEQRQRHVAESAQTRPSPQRIAEIQSALMAHGYEPGTTWEETQEACRTIANEHMWQTDNAPDARVLILIGLAGPHSDPDVAQMRGGRLDKDQRTEAARIRARPPFPTLPTRETGFCSSRNLLTLG